jgi:hypothetical protein
MNANQFVCMRHFRRFAFLGMVLFLTACTLAYIPSVIEVWRESQIVDQSKIKHLLIIWENPNEGMRRNFEDNLSAALTDAGIEAKVSYRMTKSQMMLEGLFKKGQFDAILVFKSTGVSKETVTSKFDYSEVSHDYFTQHFQVDLFSKQNGQQLLWSGAVDGTNISKISKDLVQLWEKAGFLEKKKAVEEKSS